ncbi:MAG: hypothetical protein J6U10_04685, partial [Lachnospiraceae bacterium]|nr:hypothetical protein [Lachnospiraceae bacterium]
MKIPKIANALGNIDEELIAASEKETKRNNKYSWLKWGALAAGVVLLIIAGTMIIPRLSKGNAENRDTPGNTGKAGLSYNESASSVIWPWEYKSDSERYDSIKIAGNVYSGKQRTISATKLVAEIGTYTATGYDELTETRYIQEAEVYSIGNVDSSYLVAAKIGNEYYTFKNSTYSQPKDLGELLDAVDLPKIIELSGFSENSDSTEKQYRRLTDDEYIWNTLAECREAAFVDDERWNAGKREYLSFTITSEALGVYKVAMYITKDGYLWTNAFDWQYLFDIGIEAASKIYSYALANSSEAEFEPYMNSITGPITEITSDFITVESYDYNNKGLVKGEKFMVSLKDVRISRYVDLGLIRVGYVIYVTFEGEAGEGNVINTATWLQKGSIPGRGSVPGKE